MAPRKSSKTRRRLPRAEREQRMLDAAEEVFKRAPYQAGSMDEIATLSGITKPLLYQYFGSKEALYEACVERIQRRVFAEIDSAARQAAAPEERIEIFVSAYVDFLAQARETWWLLYSDASRDAVNGMRVRNAEVIRNLLTDTFLELGLRRDRRATDLLARSLVGAGEEMGRWWSENPKVRKHEVRARFLVITRGAILAVAQTLIRA